MFIRIRAFPSPVSSTEASKAGKAIYLSADPEQALHARTMAQMGSWISESQI